MFFRTHLVILLFFWLLFFQSIPNPCISLAVAIFATMLPDIDNKFSILGRYRLSRIFNFFVKHRGITHSFLFLFLVSIPISLFAKEFLLIFILGYLLHLFLDGITVQGVSFFYPLKNKLKGPIKTGGFFENISFGFFFLADLFLILIRFYNVL